MIPFMNTYFSPQRRVEHDPSHGRLVPIGIGSRSDGVWVYWSVFSPECLGLNLWVVEVMPRVMEDLSFSLAHVHMTHRSCALFYFLIKESVLWVHE